MVNLSVCNVSKLYEAPQAFAWWLGIMAPNEEVAGSIPHAGVMLTTIVHPTMVGSFDLVTITIKPLKSRTQRYLKLAHNRLLHSYHHDHAINK